ncbi:1,4-beta-glucanase [Calothrix sp. 336/3]|nr:1,4-beta-glucanase [Calothrix sp. 336/3]
MNFCQHIYQKTKKYLFYVLILVTIILLSSQDSIVANNLFSRKHTNDNNIYPPFVTYKNQIIDNKKHPIILRGINWFGMEINTHVPHGLWVRDYKEMLAQIKSLGYNFIRLPYSLEGIRSQNISGVDFTIGANKELKNKTPLEVMDLIIQEAQRQGIFILLDSHCLKDSHIGELWYGDGFTEKDWIDTWVMLAKRYRKYKNVIGADLKNEPHGSASWGTNEKKTDWRLAAQRAGNQILHVNPHWLIVVEGVEKNVPNQKQFGYLWGANLEGVRQYPVNLNRKNQLVYSPHEYGLSEYAWFSDTNFPKNLSQRWEVAFNYISTQKIAPILIGEFGGYYVDNLTKEGVWQQKIVNFIAQKKLSFAYWSWNPNSKGTGGILQDDWRNINLPKQQLLNKILK